MVLPLFLPKNVSAPPAIEPDNPADFPDCINTITIIDKAIIICKILKSNAPISKQTPPVIKT